MNTIDGKILKNMIISGCNNLENNKNMVNDLNVFPVPDGDTGTNMGLTISAAKKALMSYDGDSVSECAELVASSLLRGARGNSGVILSLLFRGFSKGVKGLKRANSVAIANGFDMGVKNAYNAVMKPTEGTMLTVARLSAAKGMEVCANENDVCILMEEVLKEGIITLDKTPDMLPVLKQANVVDAGGKGLVLIYEGMLYAMKTGLIIELSSGEEVPTNQKQNVYTINPDEIIFAYCTEFIINKKDDKKDVRKLREYLESIGDSAVVVEDEDIIKVHVHTNHPGNAMEKGITYGMLSNMKIENMKEQNEDLQHKEAEEKEEVANPTNDYGFVVISAGEGISNLFSELGADQIVAGGQTMNPSTEDIVAAVKKVPAKTVFVLPNNKNIIMAAKQGVDEVTDRKIVVIESKTIPQGVTAMLSFDADSDENDNVESMNEALTCVKTGQITFAARDSVFDDKTIKEGEILGLCENKVSFTGLSMEQTIANVIDALKDDASEIITVYYGADVSKEEAEQMVAFLEEKYSDLEFTLVSGKQPIYYYIIAVE